jgi:hypothetical protein
MKKSKVILGLKNPSEFSLEERKMIVEEYLRLGCQKKVIWKKYTGRNEEKGNLLRWMRELGYDIPPKWRKLEAVTLANMSKSNNNPIDSEKELKRRIEQLEKALVESELRATALDTMIEVAESELKINIRKKSSTKQSSK